MSVLMAGELQQRWPRNLRHRKEFRAANGTQTNDAESEVAKSRLWSRGNGVKFVHVIQDRVKRDEMSCRSTQMRTLHKATLGIK